MFNVCWKIVLCYPKTSFTHPFRLHFFDHYLAIDELFTALGRFTPSCASVFKDSAIIPLLFDLLCCFFYSTLEAAHSY